MISDHDRAPPFDATWVNVTQSATNSSLETARDGSRGSGNLLLTQLKLDEQTFLSLDMCAPTLLVMVLVDGS